MCLIYPDISSIYIYIWDIYILYTTYMFLLVGWCVWSGFSSHCMCYLFRWCCLKAPQSSNMFFLTWTLDLGPASTNGLNKKMNEGARPYVRDCFKSTSIHKMMMVLMFHMFHLLSVMTLIGEVPVFSQKVLRLIGGFNSHTLRIQTPPENL